tara:strand:- start:479 stop:691 length:213 start_codon:yes stop_codon:yes gene_type:complete
VLVFEDVVEEVVEVEEEVLPCEAPVVLEASGAVGLLEPPPPPPPHEVNKIIKKYRIVFFILNKTLNLPIQ